MIWLLLVGKMFALQVEDPLHDTPVETSDNIPTRTLPRKIPLDPASRARRQAQAADSYELTKKLPAFFFLPFPKALPRRRDVEPQDLAFV